MTYRQLNNIGRQYLSGAQIEEAAYESRELLLYVSGMTQTQLLLAMDEEAPQETGSCYIRLLRRRMQHVPLQHLTGVQCFYGLDFHVNENALIPRPETEILVERALGICRDGMEVLDLCTGTGCILISLLHEAAQCGRVLKGTGSDLSRQALALAQENAVRLGVSAQWIRSDLFDRIEGSFDVICSNPPYIRSMEIPELQPEVRDYDPRMALDGGEDGLYFYRRIAAESGGHLKAGGHLFLEIGADQAQEVTALLAENGFDEIETITDLNGLDRVVHARRKETENV